MGFIRRTREDPAGASEWAQMITRNPARPLAVDHLIGSVQAARKADLMVARARASRPRASLLANHLDLSDVEMVWIGGELLYGTASVVQAVQPTGCEAVVVQGSAKRHGSPRDVKTFAI